MLNEIITSNLPQASAQGAVIRGNVSALAVGIGGNRPRDTDTFSAVLARQMEENTAAENLQATANIPETKTATAVGEMEQDKIPDTFPDPASNPLVAMLLANLALKITAAAEPHGKLAAAIEPAGKPTVAAEPVSEPTAAIEPTGKRAVATELHSKPAVAAEPVSKPTAAIEPAGKRAVATELHSKPAVAAEPVGKPTVAIEPADKLAVATELHSKPTVAAEPVSEPTAAIEPTGKLAVATEPVSKPTVAAEPVSKPTVAIEPPGKLAVATELHSKPAVAAEPVSKPTVAIKPADKLAVATELHSKPAVAAEPASKLAVAIEPAGKLAVATELHSKPAVAAEPASKLAAAIEPAGKLAVAAEPVSKPTVAIEPPGKLPVATELYAKPTVAAEPAGKLTVATKFSGEISTAVLPANKTSLRQGSAPTGTVREKSDMAIASSARADALISGQPGLHTGAEPLKTTELPSALPGVMPAPQIQAQTNAMVASGLQTNAAANSTDTTIAAPLGSRAWPEEFSQKVSWIGTQKNQVAELHLNPPDLGPINIILKISDNQATALFTSPHSAVREAIENAMPKLRESLADNGIMLGNATVSDQTPRDSGATNFMNQRGHARTETNNTAPAESAPTSLPPMTTRRHNGMVDTFA